MADRAPHNGSGHYDPAVKDAFRAALLTGVKARRAGKTIGIAQACAYEWEREFRSDPEYVAVLVAKSEAATEAHAARVERLERSVMRVAKVAETVALDTAQEPQHRIAAVRAVVNAYASVHGVRVDKAEDAAPNDRDADLESAAERVAGRVAGMLAEESGDMGAAHDAGESGPRVGLDLLGEEQPAPARR